MNDDFDIDGIMDAIAGQVVTTMEMESDRGVEYIRGTLDTPYPPASDPPDPPHRRRGDLQEGVSADTVRRGDEVITTYTSVRTSGDPRVPSVLEYGLGNMRGPRPYMYPAKRVIGPQARDGVRQALSGGA